MSKRAIRSFIFSCVLIVSNLVLGIVSLIPTKEVNEAERIQKEAKEGLIQEIMANEGKYDERTLVLSNTTKAEASSLASKYGASLRINAQGSFATLTLPEGLSLYDVCIDEDNLYDLPKLSLDYYAKISEEDPVKEEYPVGWPNYAVSDENYYLQTYLKYLNLANTWTTYQGRGIRVAIIDTGIDTNHPEFSGKISTASYNATYDKVVKDYDNDWSLIEDIQGHGTSVAGVIAASMNEAGISGIAPAVEVIVIKAECDDNGSFYRTSDLVFGLFYAIEQDVDVVNMSFGLQSIANPFAEATRLAVDSDVICVAAAGNSATAALTYPAADPNVIGVGALAEDSFDLASYSNYGENVDLVAPGTVYTTSVGGGYRTINGTSFASPIVAASLCLLRQKEGPAEYESLCELLYASTYDLGSIGEDFYYGFGALDVSALLLEERGTVTFNYLTDEIDETKQVFIKGHTLQSLPEPERNYCVFDGWYYDIYCTEEVEWYSDIWTQDLTLYASWTNEDDGVPYTYVTLDDQTIEIRSYTGHRRYITIPEYIDGKLVSSIGDSAFENQTRLRLVKLPSGLKSVGRSAFQNCTSLLNMDIPDTVTSIGEYAFYNCIRLSNINFTDNANIKEIGSLAFAYTGLTSFKVPRKVESISGSTFMGTSKMASFSVATGNAKYDAVDGVLFNKAKTEIVAYPIGKGSVYNIPDQVTTIGEAAFAYSRIKTIDLNNVEIIADKAFCFSELNSINIADKVIHLGNKAFYNCENLRQVNLGHSLTSIGSGAFYNCDIRSIQIPNSLMVIGSLAFFANNNLTSLTFEEDSNLLEIDSNAFYGVAITSLALPNSLLVIGNSAFANNVKLSEVNFGSELITIGSYAFANAWSLEEITFPNKLVSIGGFAFFTSKLSGVVNLPDSLSYLGDGAFASCEALTGFSVSENNESFATVDGVIYSKDLSMLVEYPAGNERPGYSLLADTLYINNCAFYGSNNLYIVSLNQELNHQ